MKRKYLSPLRNISQVADQLLTLNLACFCYVPFVQENSKVLLFFNSRSQGSTEEFLLAFAEWASLYTSTVSALAELEHPHHPYHSDELRVELVPASTERAPSTPERTAPRTLLLFVEATRTFLREFWLRPLSELERAATHHTGMHSALYSFIAFRVRSVQCLHSLFMSHRSRVTIFDVKVLEWMNIQLIENITFLNLWKTLSPHVEQLTALSDFVESVSAEIFSSSDTLTAIQTKDNNSNENRDLSNWELSLRLLNAFHRTLVRASFFSTFVWDFYFIQA